MGFYGNITNTSRTQFQFDRTYPNRSVMDKSATTDGVYIGRYVLIEYDNALAADWATVAYMKTNTKTQKLEFFSNARLDAASRLLYGQSNIVKDKYIRIPASYYDANNNLIVHNMDNPASEVDVLFLITGEKDENNNPIVTKISEIADSPYNENYNIDIKRYGPGRGYDATVWQKVYADNNERYVMIAELNTVVPSFGVSADAPTLSPLVPHFDTDSTNVYYKLHWQPAWGLRVKSAYKNIQGRAIDEAGETIPGGSNINLSNSLDKALPSDETTIWSKAGYNPSSGVLNNYYFYKDVGDEDNTTAAGHWEKTEKPDERSASIPAAIYYNKDGFNAEKISYSPKDVKDKISIEPTGLSGHEYNIHDTTGAKRPQEDTQELSILLPSLGDSMAKIWDIVYGNEEINGSKDRNTYIGWKEASIIQSDEGLKLVTEKPEGYGYKTNAVNTVAGAVNSVQDLMGMIISKRKSVTDEEIQQLNKDYIYYIENEKKYYRKHLTYKFSDSNITSFNTADRFIPVTLDTWPKTNTQYFYPDIVKSSSKPNYILDKEFHEDKEYYTVRAPANSQKISFLGRFEPYKYFVRQDLSVEGKRTSAYITSMDKNYNPETSYVSITHRLIGDNIRIYEADKYYKATFTKDDEPSAEKHDNGIYFIFRDNRYYRDTEPYNEGTNYYIPTFQSTSGAIEDNAQYFTISSITDESGYVYIEKVVYTLATGVTEDNFYLRVYYTEKNGLYTVAESFQKGTTYYTKTTTYELSESVPTIKPENAVEVKLIEFKTDTYYSYQPVNSDGYPQYIAITQALISQLSANICTLDIKDVSNFYVPNLYYYRIEEEQHPYYGSYIIDDNEKETKDRQYYTGLGAIQKVALKPYQPFKYYHLLGDNYELDTSLTKQNYQYYEKNGLYVYNDVNGIYPVGAEWNVYATTVPKGISVREKIPTYELQELKGFARHYNTVHGIILRINEILENNDTLTRELDNVQGTLNRLKDLVVGFGNIKPDKILGTDGNGRITGFTYEDDNYVNVNSNFDTNKIIFSHKSSALPAGEHNGTAATVNFGGTFNLPKFTTDEKGHVVAFNSAGALITLPKPTMVGNSGNIMTDITVDSSSGLFTKTKNNIGNLNLVGYTKATENSDIAATDTLNAALGKLEYKIGQSSTAEQIKEAINALDVAEIGSDTSYLYKISETDGKITAQTKEIAADISNTSLNTVPVSPLAVYNYSSPKEGSENIITLGTITTGTWNGTPIEEDYLGNISASKIADVLSSTQIPELDASKIITGTFGVDLIPELSTNKITSGVFDIERIPDLDAAKITTGILNIEQIPDLTADKITSGILDEILIPEISAEKITSGILNINQIPDLDAAKITTGTFTADFIPDLDSGKIISFTDYTLPTELVDKEILTTDNLNTVIGKLEARILELEEKVAALENPTT